MPTSTSFRDAASGSTLFSVLEFFFRLRQGSLRVATLVQVLAVTNDGGVSVAGTVDVQPLLQQVDGLGQVTDLPKLYGIPYHRLQGGANAVIMDPQVGDIGIAIFADRDLTNVINTKAKSAPGSARQHHLGDALYIGGVLNGVPEQYVQFTSSGITVVSPTKVTAQAPNIKLDGVLEVTGATTFDSTVHVKGAQTNDSTINATGEVTGNNIPLSTHKHTGVTQGQGISGLPTP